jgi:hypothetical protein
LRTAYPASIAFQNAIFAVHRFWADIVPSGTKMPWFKQWMGGAALPPFFTYAYRHEITQSRRWNVPFICQHAVRRLRPGVRRRGACRAFDPAAHKLQAGRINEVMVLGTPHLTQLPRSFDPAQLGLLHARLLAWRPQAIAIEALSGLQCAYLRSYPQRYADTIKSYC